MYLGFRTMFFFMQVFVYGLPAGFSLFIKISKSEVYELSKLGKWLYFTYVL